MMVIGAPSWPHGINVGAEDQTETSLVNTLSSRHLPGPPSSISVCADCFLFLEYKCSVHGLCVSFALCSKESLPNGYGNVLTISTSETGSLQSLFFFVSHHLSSSISIYYLVIFSHFSDSETSSHSTGLPAKEDHRGCQAVYVPTWEVALSRCRSWCDGGAALSGLSPVTSSLLFREDGTGNGRLDDTGDQE